MSPRRRPSPPARRGSRHQPAPSSSPSIRLAEWAIWALVFAVALVVLPTARDTFRLPKLLVAEWLALASLLPLAWRVGRRERIELSRLWRLPAVRSVVPLLLVATLGLAVAEHPLATRSALADLWIAAAALVGWSAGVPGERLRRLLPAVALAGLALGGLAILQFHGLFRPFGFVGIEAGQRLGVTSLAGNPGDLAAFLVLGAVVAQAEAAGARGRLRWVWLVVLAVLVYGALTTQTLAALLALVAGSLALWWLLLPRRRFAAALGAGAVGLLVVVLAVAPLRGRLVEVGKTVAEGRLNKALTGRLDGFRAAGHMLAEEPLAGVGLGGYEAAYGEVKLDLLESGYRFFRGTAHPIFANAHNEFLEVAAELGLPGVAALLWALLVLGVSLRRRPAAGGELALAVGGVTTLAVLALAHFPFRLALTGYPAILLLAWVLTPPAGTGREEGAR